MPVSTHYKGSFGTPPTDTDSSRGEALARRFHETYERLAPQFGYETRQETRDFDPNSPNGKLMIAVCAALSIPQSEAGEGGMRGPNNGVNCPQCGVRLPAGYSSPCPDCGTEDFTPTAQTEGSGLAEELAALLDEASTWHWNPGVFSNVREPLFYDRDDLWQRIDQLRTALSSAPAEFHMGGAAAALAITEPMQSASADVPRAHLEADHEGE